MEKETTSSAGPSTAPLEVTLRHVQRPKSSVSKQSRPYLVLKFVECIFAMVLLIVGRFTWPAVLARGNIHLALQPLVASATFLVYCPLMLIGFAIDRNTPPLVMAAMTLLGVVHFLFEASTCGSFFADIAELGAAQRPNLPLGPELEALEKILEAVGADGGSRMAADRLLLQCMLATATAATFIADAILTAKYALMRPQPPNALNSIF